MGRVEVAIAFENLQKTYPNGTQALRGLSLEVPRGAFFGLLGLNGAGKTTSLNVLTGRVRPSAGRAWVQGFDAVRQYRQAHRLLGIAPQEVVLDGRFLNVFQILCFQAGYYGIPSREARRRAEALLEAFGLQDKRKANVQELSGGMKRRLSLAKALIHDPPILILDEPTAGADVSLRQQLWEQMQRLNRTGKTVLLTTHYLEEAERLCDLVAVIHRGRVVRLGPPQELIRASLPDRLLIRTDPPLEALPAELDAALRPALEEGRLVLQSTLQDPRALEALERLGRAGHKVQSIEVQRARLEDAFLSLIREEEATLSTGRSDGPRSSRVRKPRGAK